MRDLQATDCGSIVGRADFAFDAIFLGQVLPTRAPSRPWSKSGYAVGPRRLVFAISYVRRNLWLPGCMLPGEFRHTVVESCHTSPTVQNITQEFKIACNCLNAVSTVQDYSQQSNTVCISSNSLTAVRMYSQQFQTGRSSKLAYNGSKTLATTGQTRLPAARWN